MSTLIYNANIITGDGKTVLENCSLATNGELIEGIIRAPYPSYDRSERVIDARGGFVIPGIINHHAHNVTTGPFSSGMAGPPLPKSRIMHVLNQQLLQGSTTIVNVDGLATMEEVAEARAMTLMLVQTMSVHLPLHIKSAKCLNLGGLKDAHCKVTVEDMIKQGALGFGEVAGAAEPAYYDLHHIPGAIKEKTGIKITMDEATALRKAIFAQPPDEKTAKDLMTKRGLSAAMDRLKELAEQYRQLKQLSMQACREAITVAGNLKVPIIIVNKLFEDSELLDFALHLKTLLIVSHCNWTWKPQQALEVARAIKKAGGWVDLHTGDFFSARQMTHNHAATLALLDGGLADMISTDYCGGYWNPILQVLEYAIAQNVIDLPKAIALATGNVLKAVPNVAPNRGQIAEGKIADLLILSPESISDIKAVIIGGKVVVKEGKVIL
jgi:hypothetical protein